MRSGSEGIPDTGFRTPHPASRVPSCVYRCHHAPTFRRSSLLPSPSSSASAPSAQLRVAPVGERPDVDSLELMLRQARESTGTFMETDAHPDDEDNALLVDAAPRAGDADGARHGDARRRRPERDRPGVVQPLGVLRTEELLAVHRFDGAEQYFTRAIDFGFSFSIEESIEKWGHDEIVGDFVRHIRTIRPDVIAGFLCGGEGGGQHHQASAQLTLEAFRAAADPTKYPEQITEGLRPWQADARVLHRRQASAPQPTAPRDAGSADDRRLRFRSAARTHLRGARSRGALDAQVPGHVAAAAAARADAEPHLSAAATRSSDKAGRRAESDVRRHRRRRHGSGAVRRGASAWRR